jgi:uncharacterized protein
MRYKKAAAHWLLANLLDWHRRGSKADWWEYFRLKDLTDEELPNERGAISGWVFVKGSGRNGKFRQIVIRSRSRKQTFGREIQSAKGARRWARLRRSTSTLGPKDDVLAGALFHLVAGSPEWCRSSGPYRAARDLLLKRSPRLVGGTDTLILPNESTVEAAKRAGTLLDHSVLAIEGPPGSGKTFTGARMICELVRQGKRVRREGVKSRNDRQAYSMGARVSSPRENNWSKCSASRAAAPRSTTRPNSIFASSA